LQEAQQNLLTRTAAAAAAAAAQQWVYSKQPSSSRRAYERCILRDCNLSPQPHSYCLGEKALYTRAVDCGLVQWHI
jgi:hypothetical protein